MKDDIDGMLRGRSQGCVGKDELLEPEGGCVKIISMKLTFEILYVARYK